MSVTLNTIGVIPKVQDHDLLDSNQDLINLDIDGLIKKITESNSKSKSSKIHSKYFINLLAEKLSRTATIIKLKSDLYKRLIRDSKIEQICFSTFNSFSKKHKINRVKRSQFSFFIFKEKRTYSKYREASIEISSPVLNNSKLKWRGLYQDKSIAFDMKDDNFKRSVSDGKIPFKQGSIIDCELDISKKSDEYGDIKIDNYSVKKVIGYNIDGKTSLTEKGKNHIQEKKFKETQKSLFS